MRITWQYEESWYLCQRAQGSLKCYPQRSCNDTVLLLHLPVPAMAAYDAISPARCAVTLGHSLLMMLK
jgi:hypothetical protein